MECWDTFCDGFSEGSRAFLMPLRRMIVGLFVMSLVLLSGGGAIVFGYAVDGVVGQIFALGGSGFLVAGAVGGAIVAIRAWWEVFQAARIVMRRQIMRVQ